MGCASSKPNFIEDVQGNENEYHERYLEDRVLGQGEFGVVKMIHDIKSNGRDASSSAAGPKAVKILKKGITFKDNTLYAPLKPEVLKLECRILRTLGGRRHTMKLLAIYESPSQIYMISELCSGGEMMQYVSNVMKDGLDVSDVSRIAFQLLDAVDHCAKNNVIHRDIKPENVMFKGEEVGSDIRLIDFGSGTMDGISGPKAGGSGSPGNAVAVAAARAADLGGKDKPEQPLSASSSTTAASSSSSDLLVHTTFAGSAFYISPEMFQAKKVGYTSKTDVWSAGATLYVLVAGYPADELQKAFNILQKSSKRDLKTLPNLPDDLPESFYDLLEETLKYRHKRRKTAGELLNHEFCRLHREDDHDDDDGDGIIGVEEIAAVAAAAASSASNDGSSTGGGIASSRGGKGGGGGSVSLRGSVSRHAVYLGYRKFERSVTTLLATILSGVEYDALLSELDRRIARSAEASGEALGVRIEASSSGGDGGGDGGGSDGLDKSGASAGSRGSRKGRPATATPESVEVMANERKLRVIRVKELKEVLTQLGLDQAVSMMGKLPSASSYDNFAYHVGLLRQFTTRDYDGLRRSNSRSDMDSSVHREMRRRPSGGSSTGSHGARGRKARSFALRGGSLDDSQSSAGSSASGRKSNGSVHGTNVWEAWNHKKGKKKGGGDGGRRSKKRDDKLNGSSHF